jgi:hypothetical protein
MTPFRDLLKQENAIVAKIETLLRDFDAHPEKSPSHKEIKEIESLTAELPKITEKMLKHPQFVPYVTKVPH